MLLSRIKSSIFITFFVTIFSIQLYSLDFSSIDDLAIKGGFNGVIAVKHNGQMVFVNSYGFLNHEKEIPCENNSLFRIASITKQFTAAAILILQERGLLDVHDPICKYLTNYPIEIAEKVTIHHLLTNTSGIPDYAKNPTPPPLEILLGGLSSEELVNQFKDKPLLFEPGEKYAYSSSGYILLGVIIEKISGLSYGEFIQQSILDKLGMKDTKYRCDSSREANEAIGYSIDAEGQLIKTPNIHNSLAFSSGGLLSNVSDLLLWDESLLNATLLTKESIQDMQTLYVNKNGSNVNFYGYGVEIDVLNSTPLRRKIWHGGSMLGFRSTLARYIEDELSIVILSNHDYSKELILDIEKVLIYLFLNDGKPF